MNEDSGACGQIVQPEEVYTLPDLVFHDLLGKRIQGIIRVTNAKHPSNMLILVFDDGTHYEFFGDGIHATHHLYPGGLETALQYARGSGGQVEAFVADENQRQTDSLHESRHLLKKIFDQAEVFDTISDGKTPVGE